MPSSSPVPWGEPPLERDLCQICDHHGDPSKAMTSHSSLALGSLLNTVVREGKKPPTAPAGFVLPRDPAQAASAPGDRAGHGAGAAGMEQPLQARSNPGQAEHPRGTGKPGHIPASPLAKQHISLSQLGQQPGSKGSVSLLCQHLEEKGGK